MFTVEVIKVECGNILQLQIKNPSINIKIEGQTALDETHVTLARLDDQGIDGLAFATLSLPPPPDSLSFYSQLYQVVDSENGKTSVVAYATDQELLHAYVRMCGAGMGIDIAEPARVYHMTLSNSEGGERLGSIGDVWKFPNYRV